MSNRHDEPLPLRDITILRGIVGSTAYGLAHEGSDIDRLGCYVTATENFHGLRAPKDTKSSTDPDHTEHEVGKFCRLALTCNPTVTELLWLPDDLYDVVHPEGMALIGMRDSFLSAKKVRGAFLGYANQQFRKLSERGDGSFSSDTRRRISKHARHLGRLCYQGYSLWATGTLPITLEDPQFFIDFGESVVKDHSVAAKYIADYEILFDETPTVLPDAPDSSRIDAFLKEVRRHHYTGLPHQRTGDLAARAAPEDGGSGSVMPHQRGPEERAEEFMMRMINYGLVDYPSVGSYLSAKNNLTSTFRGE